jgi:hypothetical protein
MVKVGCVLARTRHLRKNYFSFPRSSVGTHNVDSHAEHGNQKNGCSICILKFAIVNLRQWSKPCYIQF